MRSDDLCEEHADKGTKLTVRTLEEGTVLIEGDATALGFLADLLRATTDPEDHSRQLGPNRPGNALFSDESDLGLYIHCLPCPSGH